jgi:hypothetical protein
MADNTATLAHTLSRRDLTNDLQVGGEMQSARGEEFAGLGSGERGSEAAGRARPEECGGGGKRKK